MLLAGENAFTTGTVVVHLVKLSRCFFHSLIRLIFAATGMFCCTLPGFGLNSMPCSRSCQVARPEVPCQAPCIQQIDLSCLELPKTGKEKLMLSLHRAEDLA